MVLYFSFSSNTLPLYRTILQKLLIVDLQYSNYVFNNFPTIILTFIIFFSTTRKSCFGCAIGISGALHIIYKNNIIKSVHRKYLFRILLTLFDSRNYVFTITTFIFYSSLLIVLSINHKRVLYRNRYFKLNCFY